MNGNKITSSVLDKTPTINRFYDEKSFDLEKSQPYEIPLAIRRWAKEEKIMGNT